MEFNKAELLIFYPLHFDEYEYMIHINISPSIFIILLLIFCMKTMKNCKHEARKAFTLVELIVVISILVIL
jgi:prepilin-type N-terminal cleavage/methylation domain-containing protein